MKFIGIVALVCWAIIARSCEVSTPGKVKVDGGWIQGVVTNGMTVYKGIPFAAPPVGELRWKAPQPVPRWEGIRLATEFAASPMQLGSTSNSKSEDCLYLNVWTPAQRSDELLPVMVWIYGGAFISGSTAEPWYDGAQLAQKGVVFVSIAYRVGPLGFLAHPGLSAESQNHASGNYGLLDQIAALQWIQRNIEAFGGDANKVTIFGESAGAISVSMLCASPLAKGLFNRAISQSGGSFGPTRPTMYPGENMRTLKQAEDDGLAYAHKAGAASISQLRAIDADKLPMTWGDGNAWPIVDGYVIPDDQYSLYEKGLFNDVPVIIGYNSDEGLSFSPGNTPQEYVEGVKHRFGPFADELLKAYPSGEDHVSRSARNLMRDAAFGWPTWSWARLQSKVGESNVFYYFFDQHPDNTEESPNSGFGSPHAQDVSYVFQHIGANGSGSDVRVSRAMGDYWVNFAKTGNPNTAGLPEWPVFDETNPKVMFLCPWLHVAPVPDEAQLKVMDTYYKWRFTPEGKDWAK